MRRVFSDVQLSASFPFPMTRVGFLFFLHVYHVMVCGGGIQSGKPATGRCPLLGFLKLMYLCCFGDGSATAQGFGPGGISGRLMEMKTRTVALYLRLNLRNSSAAE